MVDNGFDGDWKATEAMSFVSHMHYPSQQMHKPSGSKTQLYETKRVNELIEECRKKGMAVGHTFKGNRSIKRKQHEFVSSQVKSSK